VREKPLPATCFDSFAQLYSGLIVNAPDLSSTCIEFEGTLAGRPVRVLLDSGASANFVNSDLVHELSLPTAPISSPVTVRVADGRTSVVKHSVTADLSVGTMHFGVTCMATELYHYDFVLGKPWLTVFNPFINWKLNAVSVIFHEKGEIAFLLNRQELHCLSVMLRSSCLLSIIHNCWTRLASGNAQHLSQPVGIHTGGAALIVFAQQRVI
jgi:hypothetical protein